MPNIIKEKFVSLGLYEQGYISQFYLKENDNSFSEHQSLNKVALRLNNQCGGVFYKCKKGKVS